MLVPSDLNMRVFFILVSVKNSEFYQQWLRCSKITSPNHKKKFLYGALFLAGGGGNINNLAGMVASSKRSQMKTRRELVLVLFEFHFIS